MATMIKPYTVRFSKIYVCSPYRAETETEVEQNVKNAQRYCRFVIETLPNTLPVAPHIYLTQFLDDSNSDSRRLALLIDRRLLEECNELWVFGKRVSDGMAAEITEAARMGIPMRWFTEDCKERRVAGTAEADE